MPYTVSSTGVFGVATDGNGNWVAVGNKNTQANAKTILYSSDNGVTWNSNSSYDSGFNLNNGFTDRGWGVAYGNGIWMAVGHYNTTPIGYERNVKVATSFDPITGPNWSNSPPGTGRNDVFGLSNPAICVAYGNGTWCIGGQDLNATPKGSIFYSTNNGTSWTKATNSFKGQCMGIATDGNNNWVAVGSPKSGSDLRPIKYSTDNGITWIDTTTPSASLFSMGNSVSYVQTSSGNVWVAAGSGNSRTILISTDNGITWSSGGSNTFTFNAYGVAYGDDKWVAVGDGGAASIRYSSN
ncbi:MAG: exo-alpha-sialidase [Actinobacteria bacterium]|nr:exo-alpha-sialidase [Actinomycetota bacterium]